MSLLTFSKYFLWSFLDTRVDESFRASQIYVYRKNKGNEGRFWKTKSFLGKYNNQIPPFYIILSKLPFEHNLWTNSNWISNQASNERLACWNSHHSPRASSDQPLFPSNCNQYSPRNNKYFSPLNWLSSLLFFFLISIKLFFFVK